MDTFAPDDRVVIINTDTSRPLSNRKNEKYLITLPDGLPIKNKIYHVQAVKNYTVGSQGLFITGLRVFSYDEEIPWCSIRFRKIDTTSSQESKARKKKQPATSV